MQPARLVPSWHGPEDFKAASGSSRSAKKVRPRTATFHVWRAFLVEASSHKGFDGLSPQQSGRDDMLRLAALSASLQDTVGRPHGQTNHIFGLVMFRPLRHAWVSASRLCLSEPIKGSSLPLLPVFVSICNPGQGNTHLALVCNVVSCPRAPPTRIYHGLSQLIFSVLRCSLSRSICR